MKKNIVLLLIFLILGGKVMGEEMDYKEEMNELIGLIRRTSGEEFILIQQNAVDLYFHEEEFKKEWTEKIDGISQESIFYGDPEYNVRTPVEYTAFLLEKLSIIKDEGKSVFTTNYTDGFWGKRRSRKLSEKKDFVNYNVPDREASIINTVIDHSNPEDVESLGDAKNLLYLLNPERYRTKKAYLEALEDTDYDLLIIDAFYNGKPLTKRDVEGLSEKKNGGKRLVIAYFSIGEAEDYRYYWRDEWNKERPEWLLDENHMWEGNYIVKYWEDDWKAIILDYRRKIEKAGFHGVFLDTVDTYYKFIYED